MWQAPDHLPVAIIGHCIIKITNETLVLTGGTSKTLGYLPAYVFRKAS